jgi:MoxR-like ATPase
MKEILQRFSQRPEQQNNLLAEIEPLIDRDGIKQWRDQVFRIGVEDKILNYITEFQAESQVHPHLVTGISARAALQLLLASRVNAGSMGRDFVTPDDVKGIAPAVLRHRLLLKPDAEFEGMTAEDLLHQIFEKLPVPK